MNVQFLTPVVTIFQNDGVTIDWEANRRIHDFLIANGVDGLVLMGSTGEFFTMSLETQKAFVDFAAETLIGRTRVFIGASRMQLDETVELCNYAVSKGLEEVMIVSPYYFRLSDASIEEYYGQIASRTSAKIFLYNSYAKNEEGQLVDENGEPLVYNGSSYVTTYESYLNYLNATIVKPAMSGQTSDVNGTIYNQFIVWRKRHFLTV